MKDLMRLSKLYVPALILACTVGFISCSDDIYVLKTTL